VREKESTRKIGLARALSKLGYCSRSRAADLIRAGRVSLRGKVYRNPETPVSGRRFQITVDGRPVEPQSRIYLIMNKPRGVVTTAWDEEDRDTVYTVMNAFSAERPAWVAPVGRLDKASEGLLLLSNDSEWAARITAPETHLDKTYHVQAGTIADEDFIRALIGGVRAKNGETLRAKRARVVRAGQKTCWLEIVLDEGKNRHIRRMLEAMGIEVLRLIRIAIGPLQLGDLAKGKLRPLTAVEKRMLDRAVPEHTS
jgi:23S rRNA pseudouridine2605 synthase